MRGVPRAVDIDERRTELATATARVIARAGLTGATMREVAAEAGWTTGALTHYFADKHELLAFTLEVSLEQRRARHGDRSIGDPVEVLHTALLAALPATEDAALHWKVTIAFCAQASADPDLAAVQRDAYREFRDGITALVERAGLATGPDAVTEAERLIAITDGIALQALFDPDSWPPERQRAALVAALPAPTT